MPIALLPAVQFEIGNSLKTEPANLVSGSIFEKHWRIMPAIHILEKSPWFVSGLRRAFPDSSELIQFCENAQDFLKLNQRNSGALLLIDLDSVPEEGVSALCALMDNKNKQQIILLVNRTQKTIIWEVMQAGCLCYLEKPVSIRILSGLCQRIFDRTESEDLI